MSDAPTIPGGISIARNVHFVLPENDQHPFPIEARHRAAIITGVIDPRVGLVEVSVFLQRIDAVTIEWPGPVMQEVAYYSAEPLPGTWHFPEYVP